MATNPGNARLQPGSYQSPHSPPIPAPQRHATLAKIMQPGWSLAFPGRRAPAMANEWKTVKLGDFLTLQRGFDLPKRLRKEGSIPVVSSSGVSGAHDEAKVQPPGGRSGQTGEHVDGRGLARHVGTEEAEQLAVAHVEVDACDRLRVAECFFQLGCFCHRSSEF